ncbi:MAG: valine--tRNA ligase [Armatimonadetes bacterium]|nr:valine--tRNA ligase [Armatimonadota bacterium]
MSEFDPSQELPKTYDPASVEQRTYAWWTDKGLFDADIEDDARPRYSIAIPPPNITGSLHMGHALCYGIHDLIIRWRRMMGDNVLCVPGTDHAGIATENVVSRELRKQGIDRRQIGREEFVRRVWAWRQEYGSAILNQFRRLGCSFDWRFTRFTRDDDYTGAVYETFERWWRDGHLYIGQRIANWCPGCRTSISDIEIETEEEAAKLYKVRYPLVGREGYIVVATTRPETILADVAVAVNPKDERYAGLIGARLTVPLVGREVELIADDYPDPEFGTGAVKVTPAHDPNDYEIGVRHNLPRPVMLAEDATVDTLAIREELGQPEHPFLTKYHGLDRFEARKALVADLEEQGLLESVEDYRVPLGRCERCHSVIEPLLSEQWYCRMSELSKPCIEVVEQDRVTFVPERYREIYLEWMRNVRDWNIARQLWWGHQIPAWYCRTCHPDDFEATSDPHEPWRLVRRRNPIVQRDRPDVCPQCGGSELIQDPDVLDTWFSSAIWPHAVMGWPKQTPMLERFYPTNLLITARDILYLWVARMIMTGMDHMGEIPYHQVYIYATVLNKEGKRMSKSLGTGVDPLDLIEEFGVDALRWSLLSQAGMQQSIRFHEERVTTARNFANKIWNAARFVLMNLDSEFLAEYDDNLPSSFTLMDRWMVSRLAAASQAVREGFESYQLNEAADALHQFIWNEFCDWYVEAVKPRLQEPLTRRDAQRVLVFVLDRALRLLHPFMPHITEEIWQALPHQGESIMQAPFPDPNELPRDPDSENSAERLFEAIRTIRNLRAEMGVSPGNVTGTAYLQTDDETMRQCIHNDLDLIKRLAWMQSAQIGAPQGKSVAQVIGGIEIAIPLEGMIDLEKEAARLQGEIAKAEADLRRTQGKLRNPQFLEKANPEIVQKERDWEQELLDRLRKLSARLEDIKG